MPPMAQKTLQDVVHRQILEGKTGAAKRGFFPALSSQLKFPLVERMLWRGLLPRPLQQAAAAMDGDPLRGRPLAVVGSAELLPEALRVQEPSQLLVLVEPIA